MSLEEISSLHEMGRRKFLTATGVVGITALAGCTGSDGNSSDTTTSSNVATVTTEASDTTESTTNGPMTEGTTEGEPEFEIVNIDAPQEAEINTKADFTYTVKNTGGQYGRFETTWSSKAEDDSEWYTFESTDSVSLDTGESHTFERWFQNGYTESMTFRSDATGTTFTLQWTPRQLNFGEEFTTSTSTKLTISGPNLKPEYKCGGCSPPQTSSDGNDKSYSMISADEGKQWAFADIEVENPNDEVIPGPYLAKAYLSDGNGDFDSSEIMKEGDYMRKDIKPDSTYTAWEVFQVPDNLSKSDLSFVWNGEDMYGEWRVIWSR